MSLCIGKPRSLGRLFGSGAFAWAKTASKGLAAALLMAGAAFAQEGAASDPYADYGPPGLVQRAAETLTFQSLHKHTPGFLQYQPSWDERPDYRAHAQAMRRLPATAHGELNDGTAGATTAYLTAYAANNNPQSPDLYGAEQGIAPDPSFDIMPAYTGVTRHKDGFFQKFSITETWIYQGNFDDLGINSIEAFLTVAAPAPNKDMPLLVTPGGGVHFLNGPDGGPFLPGQVYDTYLSLLWLGKVHERWTIGLGATPGLYTDYEELNEDSVRVPWRAFATWKWKPDVVEVVAGVMDPARNNVGLIPIGGIIWTPFDGMRWDLVVPKPKLAHRFKCGCGWEDWFYLGGEFGGGTWQIQHLNGDPDEVTLSDYRLIIGMERLLNGGKEWRMEIAWVFGREIEYLDGTTYTPDDSLMLRGGWVY